jgi:hypothetical protein
MAWLVLGDVIACTRGTFPNPIHLDGPGIPRTHPETGEQIRTRMDVGDELPEEMSETD